MQDQRDASRMRAGDNFAAPPSDWCEIGAAVLAEAVYRTWLHRAALRPDGVQQPDLTSNQDSGPERCS